MGLAHAKGWRVQDLVTGKSQGMAGAGFWKGPCLCLFSYESIYDPGSSGGEVRGGGRV